MRVCVCVYTSPLHICKLVSIICRFQLFTEVACFAVCMSGSDAVSACSFLYLPLPSASCRCPPLTPATTCCGGRGRLPPSPRARGGGSYWRLSSSCVLSLFFFFRVWVLGLVCVSAVGRVASRCRLFSSSYAVEKAKPFVYALEWCVCCILLLCLARFNADSGKRGGSH